MEVYGFLYECLIQCYIKVDVKIEYIFKLQIWVKIVYLFYFIENESLIKRNYVFVQNFF